ncbi:hypothetical protein F4781DRAFT_412881 [Annulohypoxylon bovei var. microspora]|nr:hypothetical protein F4781DRAFT_412881 [Annulohypoxylon bovei var. microspora]
MIFKNPPMPALRTYSKRLSRRQVSLTQNARSQKRNVNTAEQNNDPPNFAGDSRALAHVGNKIGLDWDWVKTLDQDPEGKEYFPARFTPPLHSSFLDDDDQLEVTDVTNMTDYTAWVLAKVKNMLVSKVITSMVKDPSLKPKWTISLNSHVFKQVRRYRKLKLTRFQSPSSNPEAAYAAIVGTILPPEHACKSCKAKQGPFRNCIVVPGYLNGSCAGCHYGNSGSRCSHRPDGSKRVRVAGVSTSVPLSSLPVTKTEKAQPTINVTPKAIEDIKAKLLSIMNQIEELKCQGLAAVS